MCGSQVHWRLGGTGSVRRMLWPLEAPSDHGDHQRIGPGAVRWRVPRGWWGAWLMARGAASAAGQRLVQGDLPGDKYVSDLPTFLAPSWALASLSTCLPLPLWSPSREDLLCPFRWTSLPPSRTASPCPQGLGLLSPAWGQRWTVVVYPSFTQHLLCAMLCAESSVGGPWRFFHAYSQ